MNHKLIVLENIYHTVRDQLIDIKKGYKLASQLAQREGKQSLEDTIEMIDNLEEKQQKLISSIYYKNAAVGEGILIYSFFHKRQREFLKSFYDNMMKHLYNKN